MSSEPALSHAPYASQTTALPERSSPPHRQSGQVRPVRQDGQTIYNVTRDVALATQARLASNPWMRFIGLMGRKTLAPGAALTFPRTRQIHTQFMRMAIDVVFYDRARRVTHAIHRLRPWWFSPYRREADGVIELPAGTLASTGTQAGDQLRFE